MLVPGTCECVTSQGKVDWPSRGHKGCSPAYSEERVPDDSGGPTVITRVLQSGGRGRCIGLKCPLLNLKQGKGHKPRTVGGLQSGRQAGHGLSPGPPNTKTVLRHSDFSLVRFMSNLQNNNLSDSKPLDLWSCVAAATATTQQASTAVKHTELYPQDLRWLLYMNYITIKREREGIPCFASGKLGNHKKLCRQRAAFRDPLTPRGTACAGPLADLCSPSCLSPNHILFQSPSNRCCFIRAQRDGQAR